jgi:alpha-beta hydrolase superfamily lysophospholipase
MMKVPKMRRWFERLGVEDKTYRAYPGVGHGLDFAADRAEYLADLVGWLSARVSPESPRPTRGGP